MASTNIIFAYNIVLSLNYNKFRVFFFTLQDHLGVKQIFCHVSAPFLSHDNWKILPDVFSVRPRTFASRTAFYTRFPSWIFASSVPAYFCLPRSQYPAVIQTNLPVPGNVFSSSPFLRISVKTQPPHVSSSAMPPSQIYDANRLVPFYLVARHCNPCTTTAAYRPCEIVTCSWISACLPYGLFYVWFNIIYRRLCITINYVAFADYVRA